MKQTLDEFITNNKTGMILLDAPTGSGKTYNVLQILKEYIQGVRHQELKRIFFVTNLKTNLPYKDLDKFLSKEDKKKYFVAKSYEESVIDAWKKILICNLPDDVRSSKQFKVLNEDIQILLELIDKENKNNKLITSIHNKIATISEPAFREFLVKNCFQGKSVKEKEDFISQNEWFRLLYPICDIENYKVVFLTTSKYFLPINTFYRLPFYIYDDKIINNSLTIIDEFDASKKYILNQIIENSLKVNINIVQTFIDVYYILNNLHFPSLLSRVTEYNKEKVEKGDWKSAEEIFEINRNLFNGVYNKYNLNFLVKTNNFNTKKVFLFNDGNHINVSNDRSTKQLYLNPDINEQLLKINTSKPKENPNMVKTMLDDINYCLFYFANAILYISRNYLYFKNITNDNGNDNQYTLEEAIATVMSVFNLADESRQYLRKLALLNEKNMPDNVKKNIRKGFKFIEIEDSNYHDLQSLIHQFNFDTTPENLLIEVARKSKLIGISATATLPTVIGNFDLDYLKDSLKESYCEISDDNRSRIKYEFEKRQKLYDDNVSINPILIDDVDGFTDKEKSKEILKTIFKKDLLSKYLANLEDENTNQFYFLIYCKIAYVYYLLNKNNIKSTVAFLNRIPKSNDASLDINYLECMFADIDASNDLQHINVYYIKSENFESEMENVYAKLALGESCYVITSYQTVGSGKNIQYDINECDNNRVIINDIGRMQKDFEAIYLETPRNLTQRLSKTSEDKYYDLAMYLFEQQSLYLADKLTPGRYRQNIINGFKRVFFNDWYSQLFNRNSDMCCHSAQLVIQGIGRICRCNNKNKSIFVFCDKEILSRLKRIDHILNGRLFNKEFLELFYLEHKLLPKESMVKFSKISKGAYGIITRNAYTVRSSWQKVNDWKLLRDFVLKNPTAKKEVLNDKYCDLYYVFDDEIRGYSYQFDKHFNVTELKFNTQEDMTQVSAMDCELPIMLNIPCVKEFFEKEGYAKSWKKEKCIMTPSLYNQVYKGALGEVVGKSIIESELGWNLAELDDYSKYELFDYVIKEKNVYFDFKHWKDFIKDTSSYVKKIRNKLNKVKGEKAIIINIVKRGNHDVHLNIDSNILQIPYIIDDTCNEVSTEMIEAIQNFM